MLGSKENSIALFKLFKSFVNFRNSKIMMPDNIDFHF